MKQYFLIRIAFSSSWSCSSQTERDREIKEKISKESIVKAEKAETPYNKTEFSENIESKIDIQTIKECAERGFTSFNMDSITRHKNIP